MELIIEINRGIVSGVYTNSQDNFAIRIIDEDDEHDDERYVEYHSAKNLIESGAVTDILYGNPETSDTSELRLPALDPKAFLLIRDPDAVKTETGRQMQLLYSAFIDGYLTCHAEICKFARRFIAENPDGNIDFPGFYKIMKPLLEKQNQIYDGLCSALNKSEEFDCEDEKPTAPSV